MKFTTKVVGTGIKMPGFNIPWAQIYLVAAKLQDEIIQRTQAGNDYNKRKFKGYSKRYLDYKKGMMAEAGGFIQSPSKVTLTDTARMMTSIQQKRQGQYVVIYFANPQRARIGYYHQTGAGHLPKREWLTISINQRRWALNKLQIIVDGMLK